MLRSIRLFVAAGLCEIAGGYFVWLWLRSGRGVWLGALGGLVAHVGVAIIMYAPRQ